MLHVTQQVCQCRKFQSHHQVATSYLRFQGLFGGSLLIPTRLFFAVLPALSQRLCFSVRSLRNSTQYSYNNGDNFYTLHLPQLFNFNCQIKILVNLFLLFEVYPSVTRACNVNDEAIFVLFVHKHDVRAIVIQFLVGLYREIPK